ncbi:MAG: hypothetical protein ACE5FH_08150 [Candidatus Zixiibacteriota bacterium]
MAFTHIDNLSIHGTWDFQAGGNPSAIGPQVGSGDFFGWEQQGEYVISLGTEMIDNYVVHYSQFSGSDLVGTWEFYGFPGLISQGTFIATPQ